MNPLPGPLKTEQVHAEYDAETKILRVTYTGELNPDVTNQFYAWLLPMLQKQPHLVTEARGSIYDFRGVTDFKSSNMTTARKHSQTATQQNMELKKHPVALLVESQLQERMVSVMMVLTRQSDRKKLVYSLAEAEQYISDWHKKDAENPAE
jgi:hypothetical protein